ncbi:MAG TPA: D-Ala-D-Ala carboxypeptidase family metallohydrolase [Chthoniobacterales bacterium]
MNRRQAIGLFASAGLGLLVSSSPAHAFFEFFRSAPSADDFLQQLKLPEEWLVQLGPNLGAYALFLNRLSLRRISIKQIVAAHAKKHGRVANMIPPKALWGNIRKTLKVVDQLSVRMGEPVTEVVSMYRCPSYNATCPGAKRNSYHLVNNAMDVRMDCPPRKVAAMAREMRAANLFQGGVGRYSGFTHIDTRGKNADW